MSYPGGKSGAGVYQTIINQMPPHELYVELRMMSDEEIENLPESGGW